MAYVKAPAFEGKDLTLQVGRGDVKIEEGVQYRDHRLARFVGMGFLKEVPDKAGPTASVPGEKRAPQPKDDGAAKKAEDTAAKTVDHAEAKKAEDTAAKKDTEADAVAASPEGGSVSKSPASKTGSGVKKTSSKK